MKQGYNPQVENEEYTYGHESKKVHEECLNCNSTSCKNCPFKTKNLSEFELGYQAAVDKACKWLKSELSTAEWTDILVRFRQAMEEEL